MIGRLRGQLISRQAPGQILLDVHGVGYVLELPLSSFCQLPALEQEVILHTHLAIREDAHVLYGFLTLSERSLFRALLKVNGVGGKMALLILSGMSVESFCLCVQEGDVTSLTRLPGIGKKTAERLIIEMKDRLKQLDMHSVVGKAMLPLPLAPSSASHDAISALVALGYKAADAEKMIHAIDITDLPPEEIIRQALQATLKW